MARLAVVALARPTFDVALAEDVSARAFAALDDSGHDIIGPRDLLMDAEATDRAIQELAAEPRDLMVILQVSFTDASMTVEIARRIAAPLLIWAFPEPRTGGRLRLNAFCGLNLAAHALGRAEIPVTSIFGPPETGELSATVDAALSGTAATALPPLMPTSVTERDSGTAAKALAATRGARIGLIGEHPVGFETCRFDSGDLDSLAAVAVQPLDLNTVFDRARAAPAEDVAESRAATARSVAGLDTVDQDQLDRSLRVHHALKSLSDDHDLSAMAVRCWPEMFTEYGCAACGPMAMMNEARVPCACEADVYGALTALMMQEIAGEPALLVDIVDMDDMSDTGVFWHCGLAPVSMAADETPPRADVHSNRKMPLLNAFALKRGRITLARLSQAKNAIKMVVGGGEMIGAPMSFSGTSGVVRFDRPVSEVRRRLLDEALEHHVVFAYGEHRGAVAALAERLGIPLLTLS